MFPATEVRRVDAAAFDAEERAALMGSPPNCETLHSLPGAVKKFAYRFDGRGYICDTEWDLGQGGEGFFWYHVQLPRSVPKLALAAQYLIDLLCPPLKLQDILALVSNGPFCGYVDGALVFRVNSAGPFTSNCTQRFAARITQAMIVTVSLGRIPRLGFSTSPNPTLLSEVPCVDLSFSQAHGPARERELRESNNVVIQEHVLELLLTMNHSEEADNPVPKCISNLLVHIVDTHVDHLQDIVTRLEIDLDDFERQLERGGYVLKKQMLDDRQFPKMHLDLQRLLQVIAHGEQVFPRVKDKCAIKSWCTDDDVTALELLVGRLRRLKETVGFIVNRVTAIQAGLDSWQAEQINRKLYYLSLLSIIFLPLSIITGAFGMNVGGVPWTEQRDSSSEHGFRNVVLLCTAILFLLLACFAAGPLYLYFSTWQKQKTARIMWLGGGKKMKSQGALCESSNRGYSSYE